jgi:hypothetical protein
MKTSLPAAALIVLLGLLSPGLTLYADPILFFNDRASWSLLSGSLNTIDFRGLGGSGTPSNYGEQGYADGLTVGGVTFTGSVWVGGHYLIVRNDPAFGTYILYGPPDGAPDCAVPCGINAVLPSNTTSVGWDFGNFYAPGVTVMLNGQRFMDSEFSGFIGFISAAPIDSLEILSSGAPTVSQFSYSSVPEPSSLLLLLSAGVTGLLCIRFVISSATFTKKGPSKVLCPARITVLTANAVGKHQ